MWRALFLQEKKRVLPKCIPHALSLHSLSFLNNILKFLRFFVLLKVCLVAVQTFDFKMFSPFFTTEYNLGDNFSENAVVLESKFVLVDIE